MTTESKTGPRRGLSPVLGALAAGTVAVVVLLVVAGIVDGRPGVVGAAVGGVLTLAVFALGLAAVGFVARLLPGASMLVALMTYTLQLLVLAVVVIAIDRADTGAETPLARLVRGRRHRRDPHLAGGPAGRRHARADPGLRQPVGALDPGVSDDRFRC